MSSRLKTGMITVTEVIDKETGELIEQNIKKHTYIANSKEEFMFIYVNALPVFIGLSGPAKSVYAMLLKDYNTKSVFEIGGAMRSHIASYIGIGKSTVANAFTELVNAGFLYSQSKGLYQINPRYAFKGSTSERNDALKAIIELGCTNC